MKIIAGFFLVCTSLYTVQVLANTDFSGRWVGESGEDSTLTLTLKQDDNDLTGIYCFISKKGNRIDCPDDNKDNLKGEIYNDSADIEFKSSFGGVKGRARIKVGENNMSWTLLQVPSGNISSPENYSLAREKLGARLTRKKMAVDGFFITLINNCGGFLAPCENMRYLGVRDKDNKVISLRGESYSDKTGKVIGSEYKNNNVVYRINYQPVSLMISDGERVILNKPGRWLE